MKKVFLLSLLMLVMLASCGGADNIKVSKDNLSFAREGGEENVNVSADGSWNVKECPKWVTAEIHDSLMVVKVQNNETGTSREGDIVLAGKDNVTATIHVKQITKCTHITPASDKVEFEKEGGTQTIAIDTDGSPKVEAPEGFTATFENGTLSVTAPANEAGSKRGEIKLTCEDQSATIYATQKGNICQKCGGSGKIICPKCHGKGMYWVSSMPNDFQEGCKKCGGSGWWVESDNNIKKGSGQITCPDCGGAGQ